SGDGDQVRAVPENGRNLPYPSPTRSRCARSRLTSGRGSGRPVMVGLQRDSGVARPDIPNWCPMGRLVYSLRHPRSIDCEETASMAQKVIREFIDDIDGSEAERTFTFAV